MWPPIPPFDLARFGVFEGPRIVHVLRCFRQARRRPDWVRVLDRVGLDGPTRGGASGHIIFHAARWLPGRTEVSVAELVMQCEGTALDHRASETWRLRLDSRALPGLRASLHRVLWSLRREYEQQTGRSVPAPNELHPLDDLGTHDWLSPLTAQLARVLRGTPGRLP